MSALLASINTIEELIEKIPDTETRLKGIFNYLQASERMLINWIEEARSGIQASPADAEWDLEYGLHLYWLHHLNEEQMKSITGDSQAYATVLTALRRFAPDSSLTPEDYKYLYEYFDKALKEYIESEKEHQDGGMWTEDKYARLDYMWLTGALNCVVNLLDPSSVYQPYPNFDQAYYAEIAAEKESVSIAIIGDWGCGAYGDKFGGSGPAVAVMKAVKTRKPDYVAHLGDVYYCGTADDRYPPNEEQEYLIDPWDTGLNEAGTNFTLNSNHEMYGGANGLIKVALNETPLAHQKKSPFVHQNKTPYFALKYNNWALIGLDSAYFDDPAHFYMKGALGDKNNTQQKKFVENLGDLSGKKVMVMTHHNPMSIDGKSIMENEATGKKLWDEMEQLLGRKPDIWYWGHKHLGVAYSENSILGKEGTACRCVGHSAIPFVKAGRMDTDKVDYYAHTPISGNSKQVQNGFAILTLKKDGSFSETFYEVTNEGGLEVGWTTKP